MTFRLFNLLNEIFKLGKQVILREYSDEYEDYNNVGFYDENSAIADIDTDLKEHPDAKLFVFDGDFYEELSVDI